MEIISPSEYPITTHGFFDIPSDVYHADPCIFPSLSSGIAKNILRSPLHAQAKHPRLRLTHDPLEDESSSAMKLGSLIHALVLGNGPDFAVIDADDYRTKAARELRDTALEDGFIPILAKEHAQGEKVSAAVKACIGGLSIGPQFLASAKEVTGICTMDGSVLRCRCDGLYADGDGALITDLKSCRDANPAGLGRMMLAYGYHLQAAFYIACVGQLLPHLAGRIRFVFIFAEKDPPYAVSCVELDEMGLTLGSRLFMSALETWKQCLAKGEWPGYSRDVVSVELPAWALRDIPQDFPEELFS